MSAGIRVPLVDAWLTAQLLLAALAPGCERIEIAGSIRRRRPDVGDIELVAIPRLRIEPAPGSLFDGPGTVEIDELAERIDALRGHGILVAAEDHPARGQRYAKLRHVASGLQVDLFSVRPPAQWGVIFLIRTGPAAYSQWLVTEARRRGFHVTGGALHRGGMGCNTEPCDVVETPEEQDVFAALGMGYVRPEHRS